MYFLSVSSGTATFMVPIRSSFSQMEMTDSVAVFVDVF